MILGRRQFIASLENTIKTKYLSYIASRLAAILASDRAGGVALDGILLELTKSVIEIKVDAA